ncbi:MAG: hypothetical protein EBT07_06325 [Actinobacteria bacterium]|nr:hypothetical protein [Actinomycetota bacterium]
MRGIQFDSARGIRVGPEGAGGKKQACENPNSPARIEQEPYPSMPVIPSKERIEIRIYQKKHSGNSRLKYPIGTYN